MMRRYSTAAMKKYYDIVITGGGMVGSALACKLARNPVLGDVSILLIESGPKKAWNNELLKPANVFSNRVSALNSSTKTLLKKLDVWDVICSTGCRKVSDIKVWGVGAKDICTAFKATELEDAEALAYIVENNIIIAATMKKLDELNGNIHVVHNASVATFKLPKCDQDNEENVVLKLNDDTSVECSLLVGADGVHSKVRQAMGVQYLSWNYNQRCVVATVKISEGTGNHTAWQKFASTGPVALLPMTDELSSLVWTTTPDHAKQLLSIPEESFVDALNTVLWQEPVNDQFVNNVSSAVSSLMRTITMKVDKEQVVPPTIENVVKDSRASFPVGFGHATSYIAPKVALIGDAAHRVHPLAGQGVNLGFGDIECLNTALSRSISSGSIIGDIYYLRDYETERQRYIVPKLIGIDLIQKIGGHPWSPLLAITNAAFQVTKAVLPLRKFLMKIAAN